MARQQIDYRFTSRLGRHEFVIVPVITPQGNIKHLRVRPDVEPANWLIVEWAKDKTRKVGVKSVELTSERQEAGAVFLKDAYIAEKWPEGWEEYERYLRRCYQRVVEDDKGRREVPLNRSVDHLHFPENLLPKAVKRRASDHAKRQAINEYEPTQGLVHPADASKADPADDLPEAKVSRSRKGVKVEHVQKSE